MGNLRTWLFNSPDFYENCSVLDREFDQPPANDNDIPLYSVKSAAPRDIPAPAE